MSRAPRSVRQVLERMGSDAVPEPRAAFVSDLEARLGALIQASTEGDVVPEIELSAPVGRARSSRSLVAAASAVACALALVISAATGGVGDVPLHEVATASGDHRSFSTNDEDPSASASEVDVTAGLEDAASASGSSNGEQVSGPGLRGALPQGVARHDGAGSSGPVSANAAEGQTTDTTSSPSSGAGHPAPAKDDAPAGPAPLDLEASGTAARVFLSWERYAGADFAAYLVLRAASPDQPSHPDPSGRTLMLLRIENPDMTTHHDTPKVGTSPLYRVVVVRRDGTVVAASRAVAPDVGLTSTTRAPSSSSVDLGRI